MSRERFRDKIRKYGLLTVLGITRALEKADYSIPIRYDPLIDSVRYSCGILHERISFIDQEVEEEFREKEDALNRRIGVENFYDENDIEILSDKKDEFDLSNRL